MADTPFDPSEHPALIDLGQRLRELAGDSAYAAGRDYLKKGLVKQGAVAGTTGYATVSGSTEYRVSIAFGDEVKVTCTCPAHRRNRHCKHVVAVCSALLERPGDFARAEPPPEPAAKKPARAKKESGGDEAPRKSARAPKATKADLQAAGLETVERLMLELAAGGLMTLGPEKAALLADAGELVRSLKLRRLGNLLLALQRAAVSESTGFAHLSADLYLTLTATRNHLEGRLSLDPQGAEELLGKVWRDEDLEPVVGLELVEVASLAESDGEFQVESSYLADLASGRVLIERQITPRALWKGPKPRHRTRLLVDEAGLYPGPAPQRIKLRRARRAPLTLADIERLIQRAPADLAVLRERLVARLSDPFAPERIPVLFRPTSLLTQGDLVGALDQSGRFLPLEWPDGWRKELSSLLEPGAPVALLGLLSLDHPGLRLHCLALVAPGLAWEHGPIFPDGPRRR